VSEEKPEGACLRRKAERLGPAIHKSRVKNLHVDDLGGYMIIEPRRNLCFWGTRFELNLDDVEEILREEEERAHHNPPSLWHLGGGSWLVHARTLSTEAERLPARPQDCLRA
jgi:hypothetical protein